MKITIIKKYKFKISFFLIITILCFLIKKMTKNQQSYFMQNNYIHKELYNKKFKKQILSIISKSIGKNITSLKSIFLSQKIFFGNQIQILNNIIFICEIIVCKRIILDKRYFWYIKKKIIDRNYRISIDIGDINDYLNTSTIIDKTYNFFNKNCENRMFILRKEILRNLPKIEIDNHDLYIYIRSGYAGAIYNRDYFQPPLCYYKKILNNFKFRKILIIAKDNTNKIIDILLNNYPFIIFNKNSLEIDISRIINAFNIVGLPSSFLYSSLKLNDNLKLYWHYGHHGFYFKSKKETTIFRMKPSKEYKNQIHHWKYNDTQLKLMIKDNCPYKFEIEN